jgi:hypothetical protein
MPILPKEALACDELVALLKSRQAAVEQPVYALPAWTQLLAAVKETMQTSKSVQVGQTGFCVYMIDNDVYLTLDGAVAMLDESIRNKTVAWVQSKPGEIEHRPPHVLVMTFWR